MQVSNSADVPDFMKEAIDHEWQHVFLVTNPIFSIVARMVIEKFGLNPSLVDVVYLRNTNTSILGRANIEIKKGPFDRYFEKILGFSLNGKRVVSGLKKNNQKFILYAAWADLDVLEIVSSKNCKGHVYLEEGQMSYWPIELYKYEEKNFFRRLLHGSHVRPCALRTDLYRDDALAFIGLLPDVFPTVPKEKLIILNNLDVVKKYYKPKLVGVKTIGLTCAERRLGVEKWDEMLRILVNNMPGDGVIKLHPSFSSDFDKRQRLKKIVNDISSSEVQICSDDIVLELEMLYENKHLIGPLTSLSRYATFFGSTFKHIDLY
ncbi:hypothetical protein OAS46_03085 [Alphaproteobacteria bacterium]|nr:hypothetical protein [Alphaproteobacteria bacterium]MDC1157091.1 hypothetical protein [Alphaproteobacteria bacterium]